MFCSDCGVPNSNSSPVQDRIVGGSETLTGQYPWHAALMVKNGYLCGATIIGARHVITAAHCTTRYQGTELYVHVGDTDVTASYDNRGRMIQVETKIDHPLWGKGENRKSNDISILILSEDLDLTASSVIKPACLPTQDQEFYWKVKASYNL